jgi:hypothetical protein
VTPAARRALGVGLALVACRDPGTRAVRGEGAAAGDAGAPVASAATTATAAATLAPACAEAIGAIAGALGSEATLRAYVTPGVPAIDAALPALRGALAAIARAAPERLRADVTTVATEDDRDAARRLGLVEAELPGGARGFLGLVVAHRGERDVVARIDPAHLEVLPQAVGERLRALGEAAERRVTRFAAITDRGGVRLDATGLAPPRAPGADATVRSLVERAAPWARLEDVDASRAPLDPAFAGLVVTAPAAALGPQAIAHVDAFLARGGKAAAVFLGAGAPRAGDPTFELASDASGLGEWLAGYGVEIARDVVLDPAGHAVDGLDAPGIVIAREGDATAGIDPAFSAFLGAPAIALPFASPITLRPERQPGARLRVVARAPSSAKARGPGPYALAAVVDGPLRPARAARADASAPAPGRLLVVASSLYLSNPIARAMDASGAPAALAPAARAYGERWVGVAVGTLVRALGWMATPALGACGSP